MRAPTASIAKSILLCLVLTAFAGCESRLSPQRVGAEAVKTTPKASRTPETESRGIARNPRNLTAGPLHLEAPRILVKKAERKLFVYSGDRLVRTYRVGLGLSPVGDKVRSGDHRTPEGEFYIFTKNDKSAFYLSLGLSYPNRAHAARGLRDGLITRGQYDAIMSALRAGEGPPQNTPLGGLIYIHGNGATTDWTWGCVALEDEDMKELFDAVPIGTPVRIEP